MALTSREKLDMLEMGLDPWARLPSIDGARVQPLEDQVTQSFSDEIREQLADRAAEREQVKRMPDQVPDAELYREDA